jgi:hypothetical protein
MDENISNFIVLNNIKNLLKASVKYVRLYLLYRLSNYENVLFLNILFSRTSVIIFYRFKQVKAVSVD